MKLFRWLSALSVGAVLVLGGCSSSNLKDERDQLRDENERLRAAPTVDPQTERKLMEAEAALAALRGLLADAQGSLAPAASAEQREEAREAVASAQDNLAGVRRTLEMQPDSAAKTAADEALAAVGAALAAVDEALRATAPTVPVGLLVFAEMHTTLDRAQTAVDDAQAKLKEALAADPDDTLTGLLTQAQATLSTAQISLLPLLREELAESESGQQDAEAERDAARTRADEAEAGRDTAQAARQTAETERDAARARADEAEAERDTAQAERDAARTRANEAEAELDRRTVTFGERFEPAQVLGRAGRPAGSTGSRVVLTPRLPGAVVPGTVGASPNQEDFDPDPVERWGLLNDPSGWVVPGHLDIMSAWTVKANPGTYTSTIATATVHYDPDDPKRVISTTNPSRAEIPVRGTIFRGETRPVGKYNRDDPGERDANGNLYTAEQRWATYTYPRYRPQERLVVQGHDPQPRTWTDSEHRRVAQSIPDHPNMWDPWDAVPQTSMQYREDDGLVMRFGGDGVLFGDTENYQVSACGHNYRLDPAKCTARDLAIDGTRVNAASSDVEIFFGEPTADPHGERAYYWSVDVPSPRRKANGDRLDPTDPPRRSDSAGRYELLLSNYAGPDDMGTAAASDDGGRYLDYAAFGLFRYIAQNAKGDTEDIDVDRIHTLHYGLDTFEDTASLASPIEATFKGRSMGWILLPYGGDHPVDSGNPGRVVGMVRTRADIELQAIIGGANTITGEIDNIEYSRAAGTDLWTDQRDLVPGGGAVLHGKFLLQDGVIAADGTYAGKVVPDPTPTPTSIPLRAGEQGRPMTFGWAEGEFEGAFYGPRGALETAGSWWAPTVDWQDERHGIVGSFAATCDTGCD